MFSTLGIKHNWFSPKKLLIESIQFISFDISYKFSDRGRRKFHQGLHWYGWLEEVASQLSKDLLYNF